MVDDSSIEYSSHCLLNHSHPEAFFDQNIYFQPYQWSYWRESRVFGTNGSTIFSRLFIFSFCKKYQDSHGNCNKNSGCDRYANYTGHAEWQSYKICIKYRKKTKVTLTLGNVPVGGSAKWHILQLHTSR